MKKWISVKDKLPDIDGSDKWNADNEISKDVWTYSNFEDKRGRYYHKSGHWSIEGASSSNGIEVTHWMYLPEPPSD